MIVTEPGKITERITLLGKLESCVCLVDGTSESAIVGGGLAYIAPDVMRQIQDFSIDPGKIRRIIILHSHFDHCGAVPFFKKQWPRAVVTASRQARKILSDPKISKTIGQMNDAALAREGLDRESDRREYGYSGVEVEHVVGQGDILRVGDLDLEIIEVPGHSSCSIAAYLPREKALFASDAVGIRFKGEFLASGNSNFDLYQQSLEKLARYDVDVVISEHYGASLGEDAKSFIPFSIEAAQKTRKFMEESYARTRDVQKSAKELTEYFAQGRPDYFLPREVLSLVAGQMMRYIAKTME